MRAFKAFLLAAAVLALPSPAPAAGPGPTAEEPRSETMEKNGLDAAYFAGGCFWCTESDFEKVPGVREVISGYAGGSRPNPTYEDVSAGKTGHLESVKVVFDPREVSYKELLDWFWRHVDPTDPEGSFVDRGRQYASAIFYANETQKMAAEASKKVLMESKAFDKPIVT
ncbi:MAG: peptide-methionine (S)-S-oxide reductase MsrA, partial [Proteobacteria bacterium]|nr:peptide-methionine (S)-S-oxide reductase MsrA [Pseudomonadota bacterium]